VISPRSGFLIGSTRFILAQSWNLSADFIGAGKFFF
jgi:hypothetical protein